jgi:hypothetical protein
MELAQYVDRLQDENDESRKLMGWLSGHEPQLSGEGSGESDILEPPKTHHKNAFVP